MGKIKQVLIIGAGLFALSVNLQAQTTTPDSIVQVAAEAEGLSLVAPQDLPASGTFWEALPGGIMAPLPFPPGDASLPTYQITADVFLVDSTGGQVTVRGLHGMVMTGDLVAAALATESNAVANLIDDVQAAQFDRQLLRRSFGMADSEADGGDDLPMNSGGPPVDPNGLWLQITNHDGNFAYANLNNGTNQVYAIESTTNLLSPWQVELELWPTTAQTNVLPFTVPALNRNPLFVRAEDWTGVDSDGDGIPDWWAWKYFGVVNVNATNQDAYGNTLLYDYQNDLDPNIISFTLAVSNNYVNNMSAPVQLNIAGGAPSYLAVSVDDTNYAGDANWQAYTSSNQTVNLGLTEGWHDVWVGLRGHGDDPSAAVWQWTRLKLDLTPPQIVITNPVISTVDKPVIQLQGFSPEALGGISYDLSNAVVVVTNQPVLVEGQDYSTDTLEFTTNYFQAYDVALTNGLNVITVHATDLAGNVTTLVTNFTLDYSGKTNPPVVQLLWPQDGMEIVGSNIVCRGWVGDDTATVNVQLVDANGNTNTASSLVGRDGNFYAGNLTLATGTNYLSYTITDAAGNVATTNITVVTSDLGLTLDPVVAGQAEVTGTIDDGGYTVYVNGVEATNDGYGDWSATIPPIGVGGGAVVVNAVKNGGDPTLQQMVDPPQGVFVSQQHDTVETTAAGDDDYRIETLNWKDGGEGVESNYWVSDWDQSLEWGNVYERPATSWPEAWPDWVWEQGLGDETNPPGIGAPDISAPGHYDEQPGWNNDTTSLIEASGDTEMKLATGGPNGSRQMNLWCLTASASDMDTDKAIPPEQISIGGLGNLDTNGQLWVVLSDNDPVVVTPDGHRKNYTFGVGATEFHPYISLNGVDLDYNAPTNCVGQPMTFSIGWFPYTLPGIADITVHWSLPGTFVNTNSDPNCDLYYTEDAAQLNRIQSRDGTTATSCWYVKDLQGGAVGVGMTLTFKGGGPPVFLQTSGQFNVSRPTTAPASPYQPDGTPTVFGANNVLSLGHGGVFDMSFQHTITTDAYCAGQAGYVQVIDGQYTDPKTLGCSEQPINGPALDGALGEFPADRRTPVPTNASNNLLNPFYDGPLVVMWNGCAQEDLNFQTYLMFQPPGGIWVPLRVITWELHDQAMNGAVQAGWSVTQPPNDQPTTNFPKWTKKF